MHFIPFWERYSIYVLEIFFSCTYTSSRVIKKWFQPSGISSTLFLWDHYYSLLLKSSFLLKYSLFLLQSYLLSIISKITTQVRIPVISNVSEMETQVGFRMKTILFPPGFEPGTFCVLDRCDNHYTTETLLIFNAEVLIQTKNIVRINW